jgi:hypothetical protein
MKFIPFIPKLNSKDALMLVLQYLLTHKHELSYLARALCRKSSQLLHHHNDNYGRMFPRAVRALTLTHD